MRVKRGMRGLIVDEGHLSSLLINDGKSMGALGGLFVDDGRQFQGLPSTGLPMVANLALNALGGIAAYMLWKHKWRKLGAFVGFSSAAGVVYSLASDSSVGA